MTGGVLIGLAAVPHMGLRGRILGATGILKGFLHPASRSDWIWRALLFAGLMTGPAALRMLSGDWPAIDVPVSLPAMLVGSFVVGVGVTFGSGCTFGHGVCGLARLSPRSVAATATFMVATAISVHVNRHVIGGAA